MSTKLLMLRMAIVTAVVAICAAVFLAPAAGQGQAPTDQQAGAAAAAKASALRAKQIAEQFEARARVLTVFDRQGKVMTTVGERAVYERSAPVFSPDGTRLAVRTFDLERQRVDVWVLDIATGKSTRITSGQTREEEAEYPVWSPDGSQVAYVVMRGGYSGLYRKASNGEGDEELLYRHPGAEMDLTDWSMDGRFLSFYSEDGSEGTLYVLPIDGDGERKPIEVFHSESQLVEPRLSPDSRFLAYGSNQSGTFELYVRPFDPSTSAGATPARASWRVSDQGSLGPAYWRRDGKEMYYLAADGGVMAVEVSTAPTFAFRKPTLLFHPQEAIGVTPVLGSISRDGQRVAIAVHPAPYLRQITVLDRQGRVVRKVGEPGRYLNPALSPDGRRVAVVRTDPRTGNVDIWAFDVASGRGTPVTNDTFAEDSPLWSPDGSQVAYVSQRGNLRSIYRKAWDGTGNEEQLFQYTPGANMLLTDWSADGRFLTLSAGYVMVVPLSAGQNALERKAIDWLRNEYSVVQGRFSPDSRFMAYLSDELNTPEEVDANVTEVYVRAFDAGRPEAGAGVDKPVRVSSAGARGMIAWRQDGKEMYYLTPDWEVMAVEVTTTPTFQAGTPRLLFALPGPLPGVLRQWKNVSRDGQRFVFVINVPVSASAR